MSFLICVLNQSPKHIATWKKDVDDGFVSHAEVLTVNAGQLGLGSSRPESSRPCNISAWSYFAYFFHNGWQYEVCFIYINVQQSLRE